MMSDPRFRYMTPAQQKMVLERYGTLQKQADPAYQIGLEKDRIELENLRNPQMSPADRERIGLEKRKFEYETSKGNPEWSKLSDGTLFNTRTGETKAVPGGMPTVDLKDVNSIRKEVQDTPQIKNYMQAAPIYRSMVETSGRNSKASDLNMVYGLGKIMDPTSVVRDGERVAVANTASLPDWLTGAIASLNGGSALTPETRQRIMDEAKSRMGAYRAETDALKSQYDGIAKRHGLNMADIWQDLPVLPDTAPAPGLPQAGMTEGGFRFKGGDPSNPESWEQVQ